MIGLHALRLCLAAAGAAAVTHTPSIANEPKRSFYEDENDVVPVPGTVTPAPQSAISGASSSQRLVNGVLVNSPSSLEAVFRSVRQTVYTGISETQKYVNQGYDKYYATERKVANTVSLLHEKSEDLMPNAVYVFIGALSGTILARQRGIVAKATFPVLLGIGSFRYFLPQTFASTTDFLWKLEKQKLPAVAKQQELVVAKSGELAHTIEKTTESGQKSVSTGLAYLGSAVKKYTGLNLDDDATKK